MMKTTVALLWNAALTAVVVTLLAGLFVAAMPPVYRATATVKGEPDGILIVRSGDLIEEVAKKNRPKPAELRGWLQEWTSEQADGLTLLKQNLSVTRGEQAGWIDITVEARVASTAANLANEMARAYLDRIDRNKITPELKAELFADVEAADAAVARYVERNPNVLEFAAELQRNDRALDVAGREQKSILEQIERLKKQQAFTRTDVTRLADGTVVRALQRRDSLKVQMADLTTRYGDQHQKMIGIKAELAAADQLVAEAVAALVPGIETQLAEYRGALKQRQADIDKLTTSREALLAQQAEFQRLNEAKKLALARFNGLTEEQRRYEFSEAVPPQNSLGFAQLVFLVLVFTVTFGLVFIVSTVRRHER